MGRDRKLARLTHCSLTWIVFLVAAGILLGDSSKSVAQSGGARSVKIDCTAFQRQSDGTWIATRKTTIEIDSNSITISSGAPQGSVNGLSLQLAITQHCAQGSGGTLEITPKSGSGRTITVDNRWRRTSLTQADCVARVTELSKSFPERSIVKDTVFAYFERHSFIIRCTSMNIVWFVYVGPPADTEGAEFAAKARFAELYAENNW